MIEDLIRTIEAALPEMSRQGSPTIREVSLTFSYGEWEVLAGGHPAVHIGEWGGDFRAWGNTPEDALTICLKHIRDKACA